MHSGRMTCLKISYIIVVLVYNQLKEMKKVIETRFIHVYRVPKCHQTFPVIFIEMGRSIISSIDISSKQTKFFLISTVQPDI